MQNFGNFFLDLTAVTFFLDFPGALASYANKIYISYIIYNIS